MKEFPGELIVRYLSNQATDAEQEQLLQWVSEDVANQKLFHEFKEAWDREQQKLNRFDANAALGRVNTRINEHASARRIVQFPWVKIAASLLLVMLGTVALWKLNSSHAPKILSHTTTDKIDSVYLGDGSLVILNKNSSISFAERFLTSRAITLHGEAFFDVKHDVSKPFIVTTGGITTQVLGTSFNVEADSSGGTVTVQSGRVKVSGGAHAAILNPSDQVAFTKSTDEFIVSRVNVDQAMGWIDNTFTFQDTPLQTAIESVADRFQLKAAINSKLSGCVITAKFKDADADQILTAFAHSTGIQYKIENDVLTITGKSCD